MIRYNYESYYGKPREKTEDDTAISGPATGPEFDFNKWQYHLQVQTLCKNLNLRPTEVYKMNFISCLNWLSMWFMKEKYEQKLKQK